MQIVIDASGSDSYGDNATVRIKFDEESWVEIDACHAFDLSSEERGSTTAIKVHHADGREETVWSGTVMPKWFADRLARQVRAAP